MPIDRILIVATILALVSPGTLHADDLTPPEGFRAIFNGKNLDGWHGLNPHQSAKLSGEKKDANLKQQREEFAKHWTVRDLSTS